MHPLIDQDLLNVESDRVRMRDGVKRSLAMLRSGSFDAAFDRIAIDMTGRGLDELSDDRAIDAWLMETIGDTGHICGTCRMGAPDDPWSVVDPGGRVLGIEQLWVADASVFPAVPRANTNLPRSRPPSACRISSATPRVAAATRRLQARRRERRSRRLVPGAARFR